MFFLLKHFTNADSKIKGVSWTEIYEFNSLLCIDALVAVRDVRYPFWNSNVHSVMYVIQGHARVVVVNRHG
jgi:hypothetical protein